MDDLISRQAAIDALSYCQTYLFDSRDDDKKISLEDAEYAIEQMPSAQPERKKGRWVLWNEPGYEYAMCTACEEKYDLDDLYIGGNNYPNFCPNCGADMRGGKP